MRLILVTWNDSDMNACVDDVLSNLKACADDVLRKLLAVNELKKRPKESEEAKNIFDDMLVACNIKDKRVLDIPYNVFQEYQDFISISDQEQPIEHENMTSTTKHNFSNYNKDKKKDENKKRMQRRLIPALLKAHSWAQTMALPTWIWIAKSLKC